MRNILRYNCGQPKGTFYWFQKGTQCERYETSRMLVAQCSDISKIS